jgi:hypothetical protein
VSIVDRIDASVAHPARRYNYWLGGRPAPMSRNCRTPAVSDWRPDRLEAERPGAADVAIYGAAGRLP